MVRRDWYFIGVLAIVIAMSGCGGSASSGSSGGSGWGGSGGSGGSGSGNGSGTGSGGSGGSSGGPGGASAPQPAKFVYVPGVGASIIPFSVDQNSGALSKQPLYQDPDGRSVIAVISPHHGKFLFPSEISGGGINPSFFLQTLGVNSSTGALSAAGTIPAFASAQAGQSTLPGHFSPLLARPTAPWQVIRQWEFTKSAATVR
jgi:hypothetical protein